MIRKVSLVLGILGALMLPSDTFAKHGAGGHGHGGGIMVTGTPAMAAGGVAAGTLMVLERAGASGQR